MGNQKKKVTWIASSVFFVTVALFFVIGFVYYQRSGVVAVVGGENISKEDYNSQKEMDKKFIEFAYADDENEKNSKLGSLPKDTIDKLIEEELLNQVSSELGISVTDEEITEKEKILVNSYKNEDEYSEILEEVYGRSRDQVKESLSSRILRDKISQEVTDKRSVSFIYVRYDITGMANNDLTLGQVEKLSEAKINEYNKEIKSSGFDTVFAKAKEDKTELMVGADSYSMLDKSVELSDKDKDSIWSLADDGVSDPIKSEGGYWAIYKLDEKTSGEYADYKNFIDTEKKERKVKVFLPEATDKSGFFEDLKTVFFGVADAATCADCSGAKGVKWYGYVTDSVTGNKLSGVSMKVENTSDAVSCLDSSTGSGWCGPKSGTDTTEDGYYQFGRTDGTNVFVNCGWRGDWKVTATKSGYKIFSGTYDISGRNGGIYELNVSMVADSWDNLAVDLSANPQEFEVDYYLDKSVTFSASVFHDRGPGSHGIDKYEWDLDGNGSYEEVNDSNVTTNSYGWIDSQEKKIKAKVRVTCDGGKQAVGEIILTLKRPEHKIVCRDLSANPSSGTVPLNVSFTASILDTWGYPITNYKWDFDGDNTWDRETNENRTSYTYTDRGGFTTMVVGENNQSVETEACPVKTNISAETWSELRWIELSP